MKKIININFHSRVVPIEETAYEILQQYIDSLRRYFANEEGRDEIISDIENRFSELFAETLKKGATCITDADVDTIITSMGRPEDFEQEEMSSGPATGGANAGNTSGNTGSNANTGNQAGPSSQQTFADQETTTEPRRLFRSVNDKILGGVCGGLANYLKIDPAVVRILFVLITLVWGAGFLLYIILWAVLPNKALPLNLRKRLYRNSDNRVIGGVASGLAAYFHIEVWIPRLIFSLPLLLSVLASILHSAWSLFDYDTPVFFTGGFGGTLFVTYIVLWIVLPEAVTASEKLEMRGEKVDLESIKNTIKSDLEGFKGRAKEMGSEMQERFQQAGKEVGQQTRKYTQSFATEAAPVIRRTSGGLGHAIGVLFKAFFLFIAGLIAFTLIMVLLGLAFKGDGILTLKSFVLAGFWQNFLSWTAFFLFLVIPVIALLTWLIRRITGVRSHNPYLGYTFATLWVIGLFCSITLAGMVIKDFRTRQHVEEDVRLTQPVKGKLIIRAAESRSRYYDNDWWFASDWRNNDLFTAVSDDSLILNTIRVSLLKSVDSFYHVQIIKFSHGNNPENARTLAQQVVFPVNQTDSTLYLPDGFAITRGQKFRNQQVLVAVAIPVGKRIIVNKNIERYHWFTINVNNRHIHWNERWDDDDDRNGDDETPWSQGYSWNNNVEYVMTSKGLIRTDRKNEVKNDARNNNDDGDDDDNDDDDNSQSGHAHTAPVAPMAPGNDHSQPATESGGYRYHQQPAPVKANADSVVKTKKTAMLENDSHLYLLSALFQ